MAKSSQLKIVDKGSPLDEARGRLQAEVDAFDRETQTRAGLAASREQVLLDGNDDLLDQLDESLIAIDRKIARHRERIALLQKQVDQLEQAELAEADAAERQARYEAAKELVAAALRFQNVEYKQHATAIAGGLDLLDRADRAAATVNADLPVGAEPLQIPSTSNHVAVNGDDLGWRPAPLPKRVGELPGVERYDRPFWPRNG